MQYVEKCITQPCPKKFCVLPGLGEGYKKGTEPKVVFLLPSTQVEIRWWGISISLSTLAIQKIIWNGRVGVLTWKVRTALEGQEYFLEGHKNLCLKCRPFLWKGMTKIYQPGHDHS